MRATPPFSVSLYLFLRVKEVKFGARPLDLRSALAARLQRCLDSRGRGRHARSWKARRNRFGGWGSRPRGSCGRRRKEPTLQTNSRSRPSLLLDKVTVIVPVTSSPETSSASGYTHQRENRASYRFFCSASLRSVAAIFPDAVFFVITNLWRGERKESLVTFYSSWVLLFGTTNNTEDFCEP